MTAQEVSTFRGPEVSTFRGQEVSAFRVQEVSAFQNIKHIVFWCCRAEQVIQLRGRYQGLGGLWLWGAHAQFHMPCRRLLKLCYVNTCWWEWSVSSAGRALDPRKPHTPTAHSSLAHQRVSVCTHMAWLTLNLKLWSQVGMLLPTPTAMALTPSRRKMALTGAVTRACLASRPHLAELCTTADAQVLLSAP